MSVLSINTSAGDDMPIGDKIVRTGIYKRAMSGPAELDSLGIKGDTIVNTEVHGGEDQAVYLYSAQDYAWWSEQLGTTVEPGTFGENLTIAGFHEGSLRVGDRLVINDQVCLEITAPRVPCVKFATKMNDPKFVKKFVAAERPGAYARVITPGTIQTGDSIEWQPTQEDHATVQEIFVQWHQKSWDQQVLARTLSSPISRIARRIIEKRTSATAGK